MKSSKGAGMTGERVSEIERAPLQSNPWVGIKKSIVEHKVSLMQQGEAALTPTPVPPHTQTHTHSTEERDVKSWKEMDQCKKGDYAFLGRCRKRFCTVDGIKCWPCVKLSHKIAPAIACFTLKGSKGIRIKVN